jgi:hypothetical protein
MAKQTSAKSTQQLVKPNEASALACPTNNNTRQISDSAIGTRLAPVTLRGEAPPGAP